MGRLIGGAALLLVAAFMLLGFFGAEVDPSAPATLMALVVAVGLPAAGGAALLALHFREGPRVARRREALRRQTFEAEILRLAARRGGRLNAVEVVAELGVSPEAAEERMNDLMRRDLAEIEITDSGGLVYAFPDVERLGEKGRARGVLDD